MVQRVFLCPYQFKFICPSCLTRQGNRDYAAFCISFIDQLHVFSWWNLLFFPFLPGIYPIKTLLLNRFLIIISSLFVCKNLSVRNFYCRNDFFRQHPGCLRRFGPGMWQGFWRGRQITRRIFSGGSYEDQIRSVPYFQESPHPFFLPFSSCALVYSRRKNL